jgi:chromosome segregation protein
VRLTHIKLAGFKSFVDPTHIPVSADLVGVVGPNGCGKSNVIDAVRWVLGESSARQLRGENMHDVIFNGSGERKPVGRASVELIFDNSMGKAIGQWSVYNEIAVKRVLERDGDSSYYINNIHVRRRDVADIFLGTGLGARAYAIIEQGMISRIIEAKPEELRVYLEEAAGVSKYRERRRETELRLEDTRENLLRVDDIRQELEKQLLHLEGQAETALRYRSLEATLKTTQQTLWMIRKRDVAAQRVRLNREKDNVAVELEAETARLREAERGAEQLRTAFHDASDAVHAAQGALYEVNAEVARIEQGIQHLRDTRGRAQNQLQTVRGQESHQQAHLAGLQTSLSESERTHGVAAQMVEEHQARVNQAREKIPAAESEFRTAGQQLESAQRVVTEHEQQIKLADSQLGHAQRLLEQIAQRKERLTQAQAGLDHPDPEQIRQLAEELASASQELALKRESLAEMEERLPELDRLAREADERAESTERSLGQVDARLTALQSLQEQVSRAGGLEPWLDKRELRRNPRLWQGIRIREGWEDALESVLRERLNSVGLEDLSQADGWLNDPPPGKLSFHALRERAGGGAHQPHLPGVKRLLEFVSFTDERVRAALEECLSGVYVLEDPSRAGELTAQLSDGMQLVSAHGHIFSRYTVGFHAADSEIHGILSRQREIEELFAERERLQIRLTSEREEAVRLDVERDEHAAEISRMRRAVEEVQEQHHQLRLDHMRLSQVADAARQRAAQIERELEEVAEEAVREESQLETAQTASQSLAQQSPEVAARLDEARRVHAESESSLTEHREQLRRTERDLQEAIFQQKTVATRMQELAASIQMAEQQLGSLQEQAAALAGDIEACDESVRQTELQGQLNVRVEREQILAAGREGLAGAEQSLRETEQTRLAAEQKIEPLRGRIGELQLKEQEARIHEESLAQQLLESGANEEELAAQIEKGVRAGALQSEVSRLGEEITALGAVNLAAVDELGTARERKNYLDAQALDLNEALATLENAIRRIDKETRERMQATFAQVNKGFSEMFPALFGGGEARLEMTGEEILDAGIQVIARPPGKRNASIHLLSGGEKALTALSLVFSLFQLNPAPFCLLDEVDAPLDDNNTSRFCDLVRKMSKETQFLFITHNKITMEMARQLIGVTMQEQGVSRIVAVDIDEALRMREEVAA